MARSLDRPASLGSPAEGRWPARAFVLPVFLAVALLLGGGGSPSPLPEMLVEWAALAALVAVAWLDPERPWPRPALGFAAALFVLPAAQLIPLPPELWQALPGRANETAALALVGESERWMPLSVSPARTLAALLAMLPPAAALVLAARATPQGRTAALQVTVAVGLASVAVGAGQLAAGPGSALHFYGTPHAAYLTGFQANRNAAADVLLIALLAVAALTSMRSTRERTPLAAVAAVMLAAGTLLTASRAGIGLLLAVCTALVVVFARAVFGRVAPAARVALGAGIAAVVALGGWAMAENAVLGRIAGRFADGEQARPQLWQDTVFAIGQHWPVGSGFGSFVPVFVAAERLEAVDPSYPNRAHNDFLELALEAGLPGLVLLAVLVVALGWRLATRLRTATSPQDRSQLLFAGAALTVLAAHSIVDYPLRSMAIATLAGVAAGIILVRSDGEPALRREAAGRRNLE